VSFRPSEGKTFAVLNHSGSPQLVGIVEKLLASEAEASRPEKRRQYQIGPENYKATVRGTENIGGRECYIVALMPKMKSRFLVRGYIWVDKTTGDIVQLDGITAASVSMWIGHPHVVEECADVDGICLPKRTTAVSSNLLLGESELEIRYTDYQVGSPAEVAAHADTSARGGRL
jgi:hypothetical protein